MANVTGKGGFKDHPENTNKEGRPPKDMTWSGSVKRLTNMTREELIEYVGPRTRIGKLLKELPPNVPVKDALILSTIIQFGREPNASLFNALADREDGKLTQPFSGDVNVSWKEFVSGNTESDNKQS